MGSSNINFDTKQFDELLKGLTLTDKQKYEATSKAAKKLKNNLENTAPYETGELQEKMKIKKAMYGGSLVTNDAESEPDSKGKKHRYGWILEHSEEKGHQGWWSRECDNSEEEIEDILEEEILNQLGL